jgi:hypothetical protein
MPSELEMAPNYDIVDVAGLDDAKHANHIREYL